MFYFLMMDRMPDPRVCTHWAIAGARKGFVAPLEIQIIK
jgi:hypothetical protein